MRRSSVVIVLGIGVLLPALGLGAAVLLGTLRPGPPLKQIGMALGGYVAWIALWVQVARIMAARRRIVASGLGQDDPSRAPRPLEGFVGRDREIQQLERELRSRRGAAIMGVVGTGGSGKTELAKIVAHRVRGRYRDGVLWADCGQHLMTTIADLWAASCGAQLSGQDRASKAAAWRSLISSREALLIFDNVQPGQRIEDLFAGSGPSRMLITTRDAQHPALSGIEPVCMDPFSRTEALALVGQVLGPETGAAQEADADRFFDLVGHLPLATSMGLCVARDQGWSLAQLTHELSETGALEAVDEGTRDRSLRAVFDSAWLNLSGEEQQALATTAVFSEGPSFDTTAMTVALGVEEEETHGRLDRLARQALLTDLGGGRWSLPPLLREFVAEKLPSDHLAWGRMAAHYLQVAAACDELYTQGDEGMARSLGAFYLDWPHIRAGQRWAVEHAETDREALQMCSAYPDAAPHCLNLHLSPRERIAWLQPALRAAREMGDRRGEGNHLLGLGSAYAALGEAAEAVRHHQRALEIAQESEDRRMVGHALDNLGSAYAALGEARAAMRYHQQALEIAQESEDRLAEANALSNLGGAHGDVGEAEEAITYYEQALDIWRELGDRRREGVILGRLGLAHADLGQPRQSISYCEWALDIARELGDRREEGKHLSHLGDAYAALGEAREAITHYQQSVEIAREIGDRREEGIRLGHLGQAYSRSGQERRAIDYYQQALEIAREMGDQREEGDHLGNLGLAYAALGQVREAIPYYEQSLEIAQKMGDREAEGETLGNLGLACVGLGEVREAITCYEQALDISREIGDRQTEGTRLGNLGLAYADLGELEEAIAYYGRALEIAREIGDRRREGNYLGNLGLAYAAVGDTAKARELMEEGLRILEMLEDPSATRARELLEELG